MHLIRQHILDVDCSSQNLGKEIQSQLGQVLEGDFYPKLQQLLDRYAVAHHTWNIDALTVELPPVSPRNWKQELVDAALQQIECYLQTHAPVFPKQKKGYEAELGWISDTQQAEKLFFDFLKTGLLPENSLSRKLVEILALLVVDAAFVQRLMTEMTLLESVWIRWVFAIPPEFKQKVWSFVAQPKALPLFFQKLFEGQPVAFISASKILDPAWLELLQWFYLLHRQTPSAMKLLEAFLQISQQHMQISATEMRAVFAYANNQSTATHRNALPDEIQFFLEQNAAQLQVLEFRETMEETTELTSPAQEFLYVENAGLVILHPFLPTLFEQTGLCQDNHWTSEPSQHKAVLLTQYLVSGETVFFENELALNKILCGLPVESVINTQLQLSDDEKQKCHQLLEAVNEHWKAMNGSSIVALRETFLQREGKIDASNDPFFELWVAEKGVDILLEQLPWGIGLFKTPWMLDYMNCYWD
ncbi:contractile injection system tape measure protein [Flavobacterium sp.]|uniref:contractile injection system tape measure protein n=1 Tax=Flavobacterium sp. TaxID=239 RepID=UPI0039E67D0A